MPIPLIAFLFESPFLLSPKRTPKAFTSLPAFRAPSNAATPPPLLRRGAFRLRGERRGLSARHGSTDLRREPRAGAAVATLREKGERLQVEWGLVGDGDTVVRVSPPKKEWDQEKGEGSSKDPNNLCGYSVIGSSTKV